MVCYQPGGDGGYTLAEFDWVLSGSSPNFRAALFDSAIGPLIRSAFEGFNSTVLAYGQTGSGKTYTMGTACTPGAPPAGLLPLTMAALFDAAAAAQSAGASPRLSVQFVELYNEAWRDLLCPTSAGIRPGLSADKSTIVLQNALTVPVESYDEMAAQLAAGSEQRATAATRMNDHSSRSHAVFTIHLSVESRTPAGGKRTAVRRRRSRQPASPPARTGSPARPECEV